jgi:hypothetical protein
MRWREELEEPHIVKISFVSIEKVGREEYRIERRKERRRVVI